MDQHQVKEHKEKGTPDHKSNERPQIVYFSKPNVCFQKSALSEFTMNSQNLK